MSNSAGLNQTPSGERITIGFFGKTNAGKSTLVNAVTAQELAVVSDVKGTTTDPVSKAMELLPLGPVTIIDTAGIDDDSALGEKRRAMTKRVLNKSDVAVLVVDARTGLSAVDYELIEIFNSKKIKFIIALNKSDLLDDETITKGNNVKEDNIYVSALNKEGIDELKERIATLAESDDGKKRIIGDFLNPLDFIVLVTPIDSSAPKGRLILPQQQTIRDILESSAISVVVQDTELKAAIAGLSKPPKLVVTDSQAFEQVAKDTPAGIMLTSFSILFARYKGDLATNVRGVKAIEKLKDGDKILVCESCTHHRQCEDIGTVKIPNWLLKYTGKQLDFEFTAGVDFPDDLSPYSLIIHCGGCMAKEREIKYRLSQSEDQNIPMTNYGIVIAYMKGILERSLEIFPDIKTALSD